MKKIKTKQLRIYLAPIVFIPIFFSLATYGQSETQIPTKIDSTVRVVDDRNLVFEKTEVDASVDLALWRKHLETNLPPYLEQAANKNMKPGQYTVIIRFIVERNGSLSNVVALNDVGYGLTAAAMRVVRTGPKWKPAEQNGRLVRSYHTQPITFAIIDDKKENKKRDN